MCRQGCPVHTPIPQIICLFKKKCTLEAGERLFENNPMSIICATVCDHMMQCTVDCVLGGKGQTSSSARLKNVSDTYFDRMTIPQAPKKGPGSLRHRQRHCRHDRRNSA